MATLKTITVGELRELLEDYEDDVPVVFASNYGDISRTQQVHPLRGDGDMVAVRESAYSDSGYAVAEAEDLDADDDELAVHAVLEAEQAEFLLLS